MISARKLIHKQTYYILIFCLIINQIYSQGLSSKDMVSEDTIDTNLSHGDSFSLQGLNNGIFGTIYGKDDGKVGVQFRKIGELEGQYDIGDELVQDQQNNKPTLCEIDANGEERFLALYLIQNSESKFGIKGNIIDKSSSSADIEIIIADDVGDEIFGQTCTKIPGSKVIVMWYQKKTSDPNNAGIYYQIIDTQIQNNRGTITQIAETPIKQYAQIKSVGQNVGGNIKLMVLYIIKREASLEETNLCLNLIELEYDDSNEFSLGTIVKDDSCIQYSKFSEDDYTNNPDILMPSLKNDVIQQQGLLVQYAVVFQYQDDIYIFTYNSSNEVTCKYILFDFDTKFKQSDLSIYENKVYIVVYGIKLNNENEEYIIQGLVQDVSECPASKQLQVSLQNEDFYMENTGTTQIEAIQSALTQGENECSLLMGINYTLGKTLIHLNYLIHQDGSYLDVRCNFGCPDQCYQCIGSTLELKELREIGEDPNICLCKEGYYDDPSKFGDDYMGDIDCHRCSYKCKVCETEATNCSVCNGLNRDSTNSCECEKYYYFNEEDLQYTDVEQNQIDYSQEYNCSQCIDVCDTCNNSTDCLTCKNNKMQPPDCLGCIEGYGLFEGECVKCDGEDRELKILGTDIYESCVCKQKFFLDGEIYIDTDGEYNITCTACLEQCDSCENNLGCLDCLDPTRKLPECLICDDPTYSAYLDVCIECTGIEQITDGEPEPNCICNDTFFILDNGTQNNFTCESCQATCSTCENLESCSTCPNDRHSPEDSCNSCIYETYAKSLNDDLNCITCDGEGVTRDGENTCICQDMYYNDSNITLYDDNFTCQKCSELCNSCDKQTGDCIDCAQVNRSPPDCICSLNFFLDENSICQKCDSYCDQCQDESNNCTNCQGLHREAPDCNCPAGFIPNENKSEDCIKCQDDNCLKCDSSNKCLEYSVCDPIIRIPPLCLEITPPTCEPGSFLETISQEVYQCTACLPTCATCSNLTSCDVCLPPEAGVNIYEECYKIGKQYDQITCSCIEVDDSKEVACPSYCSECNQQGENYTCGACLNANYQYPLCVCLIGQYWDDKTRLCTNCYTGCNTCTGGSKNCDDKIIIINPGDNDDDITINNNPPKEEQDSYLWLYILIASILILLLFAILLVIYFRKKREKQKVHNKFLEGKHKHEQVNNPVNIPTLMIESIDHQPAFDFETLKTQQEKGATAAAGGGGIALATANNGDAVRNQILSQNRELMKQQEDLKKIQQMEEEEEEYYGEDSAYNKSQNQLNQLRQDEINKDKMNNSLNQPYGIDKNFQKQIKNAGNGTGQAWNHQNNITGNPDDSQDLNNLDSQNPNDISGLSNLPHQNNMDISLNDENYNNLTGNQQLLSNSQSAKKPPHPTTSSYYINSGLKANSNNNNNFNDTFDTRSGGTSNRKNLKDRKNQRKKKDVKKYQQNQIISSSRLSGRDINSSGTLEMNNPLLSNKKKNSIQRTNSNNSINTEQNLNDNEINSNNDITQDPNLKKQKKMVKKVRPNGTIYWEEEEVYVDQHRKNRNFNPANKVFSRKEQQKIDQAKKDMEQPVAAFVPLNKKQQQQPQQNKEQTNEIKDIIQKSSEKQQQQNDDNNKNETQQTNSNNSKNVENNNINVEEVSEINDDDLNDVDIEIDFAEEKKKAAKSAQKKLQGQKNKQEKQLRKQNSNSGKKDSKYNSDEKEKDANYFGEFEGEDKSQIDDYNRRNSSKKKLDQSRENQEQDDYNLKNQKEREKRNQIKKQMDQDIQLINQLDFI